MTFIGYSKLTGNTCFKAVYTFKSQTKKCSPCSINKFSISVLAKLYFSSGGGRKSQGFEVHLMEKELFFILEEHWNLDLTKWKQFQGFDTNTSSI